MSALAGWQSLDASDGDNKDENNEELLYATATLPREGDVKWLVDCGATQERAIALLSQHGSLLAAIQAVLNATPNEASDDLAIAAAVAGSFPTDVRRMVRQLGSSLKGQAEKAAVALATLARDKPGSRRAIVRALNVLDPCRSNGLVLKNTPDNTPVSRRNVKSAELVAELRALVQSLNEVPAAEDEELVVYCEAFCEETNASNGDASLSAKMKGPGLLRSWTGLLG